MGSTEHPALPVTYLRKRNFASGGWEFEKDLAFTIFLRASLAGYKFTLATEMQKGGKFDDVVLFINNKVWLFQAKHAAQTGALIEYSDLFPSFYWTNEPLALPKYVQSFLAVKDQEEFRGFHQQYIIFTKRSLNPLEIQTLLKIECIENAHEIITWNRSVQNVKGFTINTDHAKQAITECNNELNDIKEGIIELFNRRTETIPAVLEKYKSPLKNVLALSRNNKKQLIFNKYFQNLQTTRHEWLLHELEESFRPSTLETICRDANAQIENFFTGRSQIQHLPNFVGDIQNDIAHRKIVQDKINVRLHIIKDSIIKLFTTNRLEHNKIFKSPLKNCTDSLRTVLTISGNALQFHPRFLDENSRQSNNAHVWLFDELQAHYQKPLAEITMTDINVLEDIRQFFQSNPKPKFPLPEPMNIDDIENFLNNFVVCEKQLDSDVIINHSIYSWMQKHLLPKYLMNDFIFEDEKRCIKRNFRDKFDGWCKETIVMDEKTKPLDHLKGEECKKGKYLDKSQAFEKKYVSRTIIDNCNKKHSDSQIIESLKNANENKCYVLIGTPGSGKTTTVEHIGFEVQKSTTTEVHIVYLKQSNRRLENSEPPLSNLQRKLSNNENQILIIIDAFDNLDQSLHDLTIATIQNLLAKPNIKIIITGRTQVKEKLEHGLTVNAVDMLPLDVDKQVQLLEKYCDVPETAKLHFNKYSKKLLGDFYSFIDNNQKSAAVMIRMLLEVFSSNFKTWSNGDSDEYNFDILDVVEKFVNMSYYIRYEQDEGRKAYSNIKINEKIVNLSYKEFIIQHQWAALKKLENMDELLSFFENFYYEQLIEPDTTIMEHIKEFEKLIQTGQEKSILIEISPTSGFEFVEKFFADYFIAKFIFDFKLTTKLDVQPVFENHKKLEKFHELIQEKYEYRMQET